MSSFFPISADEYIIWFENFIKVSEANMIALNLEQATIDEWKLILEELKATVADVESKKIAYQSSVIAKDLKFDEAKDVAKEYNGIFQHDRKIPQVLIKGLGLHQHDTTPSHEVPFPISDLTVSGSPAGIHRIDWDKNGNKSGTQYIIEVKTALDGAYQNVDTVTATKYARKGQTPGVPAWYRITPRRGKLLGDPSEAVGVYT